MPTTSGPIVGVPSAGDHQQGNGRRCRRALSHAAIGAHECAIPAVLGVAGATLSIRDGGLVRVDGAAGTTALMQQSGPGPNHAD